MRQCLIKPPASVLSDGFFDNSMRILRANLSHAMEETRWASFNSDIFKYCWIVVNIPIVILILPITAGAYDLIYSGKLSCAKDAVPLIV